ncbi:response regulator transcription factor [Mesorhizobium sp. SB112]|uniref:response regulator transcription factor n=1 Tax=Mesorhizobium sp. SB112 TaxID=3151853 RepID=UPI00326707EA
MSEPISVVVADDHPIYRAGLLQSLSFDPAIRVVGEAASAPAAIEIVAQRLPDIALLDISMPGGGIEAAKTITQQSPSVRVIMLTVSETDADVMQALDAGVVGYLLKGIEATHLISAIKAIAAGDTYISPQLGLRLLSMKSKTTPSIEQQRLALLSQQEHRVLRLLAKGRSNGDIAKTIGVQESTAKFHVTNILWKLQVRNRVEATIVARNHWDPAWDTSD